MATCRLQENGSGFTKNSFLMLTKNREEWLKEYRRFVSIENDEKITGVLERKKWPAVLGSERFIDWVKGKYYVLKADQEVPQAKDLAPEADSIINAVCKFYNVGRDELYRSIRGKFNEPRNVAIFLTRKLRRDSLKEIGHQFQMEKYSSIRSIIERMKKRMLADRNLKKRVDRVANGASKGQEQTPLLDGARTPGDIVFKEDLIAWGKERSV